MSVRACVVIAALACAPALAAPAAAAGSGGSGAQVAWVRRAAGNFVGAELRGDGAGACAVLDARLRAASGHRTCAQRWNAKLRALLRIPGARASLRADAHAIGSARVAVDAGHEATITLPTPLMAGRSRFVWSENCWMLSG
ncbi:MAG TPA: hypothetical protein VEJ23_09290 [Solirubrobacteraceae bacterium]|nr:hypothetical protein [Solirubrobacteraceae bacterium]